MATVSAGPLSSVAYAYVDANVGVAPTLSAVGTAFLDENVGLVKQPSADAVSYVDENVGLALGVLTPSAVAYMDENIGLPIVPGSPDAIAYLDLGDVTTDVPTPYLWFVVPDVARPGDPLKIYVAGAGSDMTKCSVERYIKETDSWVQVSIASLINLPAQPEAYGDLREIDPLLGANVEHCEIQLAVPVDAPPNEKMLLRVRTIL
jgi:hypothetical protein